MLRWIIQCAARKADAFADQNFGRALGEHRDWRNDPLFDGDINKRAVLAFGVLDNQCHSVLTSTGKGVSHGRTACGSAIAEVPGDRRRVVQRGTLERHLLVGHDSARHLTNTRHGRFDTGKHLDRRGRSIRSSVVGCRQLDLKGPRFFECVGHPSASTAVTVAERPPKDVHLARRTTLEGNRFPRFDGRLTELEVGVRSQQDRLGDNGHFGSLTRNVPSRVRDRERHGEDPFFSPRLLSIRPFGTVAISERPGPCNRTTKACIGEAHRLADGCLRRRYREVRDEGLCELGKWRLLSIAQVTNIDRDSKGFRLRNRRRVRHVDHLLVRVLTGARVCATDGITFGRDNCLTGVTEQTQTIFAFVSARQRTPIAVLVGVARRSNDRRDLGDRDDLVSSNNGSERAESLVSPNG